MLADGAPILIVGDELYIALDLATAVEDARELQRTLPGRAGPFQTDERRHTGQRDRIADP